MSKPDVLPFPYEAERAVLGALLIDNNIYDEISTIILERDFYSAAHRTLYRAISSLINDNMPADIFSVNDKLVSMGKLEASGGGEYLIGLVEAKACAVNGAAYARLVYEASLKRDLISEATEIAQMAYSDKAYPIGELLDCAEAKIFKLSDRGQGIRKSKNVNEILSEIVADVDERTENPDTFAGLSTGFKDLDEITKGLQKSDLIVLAGRPSMGKTSLALNIVQNVVIGKKKKAIVFSLEMTQKQLTLKMITTLAMLDLNAIVTGKLKAEDWPRFTSAIEMLHGANESLHFDDSADVTVVGIRSRARKKARDWGGLDLIVIDYIQLMQGTGQENRTNEISYISRHLKLLARELNVPVIVLSQLNRALESRGDKRPMMSDLRDSGAIEQDADLVMFVYRDDYYNQESQKKGEAELIISKHRNGATGMVALKFKGIYSKFEDAHPFEYTYYKGEY